VKNVSKAVSGIVVYFGASTIAVAANMCMIGDPVEPEVFDYKGSQVSCAGCYLEEEKLMVPANTEITISRKNTPNVKWKFVNRRDNPSSVEQVMNTSPRRSVVSNLEVQS